MKYNHIKYIFSSQNPNFLTGYADPDVSELVWLPLIRIRMKIKSWIRIYIETNADPQHWS
jgi:hypothetical protein